MKDLTRILTESTDADSIEQSVRYLVAEFTDDADPAEMRQTLASAASDPARIDELISRLTLDSTLLEEVSLAVLSEAWDDPSRHEQISRILADAKTKLPVIEVSVLAISALYGIYLFRTGGKKRTTRYVKRDKDGGFTLKEETEYAEPNSVFRTILGIFDRQPPGA
ncbi:hypothetical protein AB0J80_17385 [Actinoplanes sp. NPDC049548]|uniref:hypothetical protein n=1 Tax=Actinoplanes sp. NPDC049548 TaxID=3155152 RepID=UPI00341B7C6C